MHETPWTVTNEEWDIQVADSIVRFLRKQRHDFMNHIQVIWGYLQLGKAEQSVRYIVNMNRRLEVLGRALKLDNPLISLLLFNKIVMANDSGINIDLEVEDINFNHYFSEDVKTKLDIFSEAYDNILEMPLNDGTSRDIYIDIFEECNTLHIVISNSHDLVIDEKDDSAKLYKKTSIDIPESVDLTYLSSGSAGALVEMIFKS